MASGACLPSRMAGYRRMEPTLHKTWGAIYHRQLPVSEFNHVRQRRVEWQLAWTDLEMWPDDKKRKI